MLTNADIAIDAINLLHELMEPDVAVDSEENALLLIDDFVWSYQPSIPPLLTSPKVAKNGLELLVQNLARLDEKQVEEKPAVNRTLNIIENLIEIKASIATARTTELGLRVANVANRLWPKRLKF